MPECQGCGGHVSERAFRVLYPEYLDAPDRCQNCGTFRDGRYQDRRYGDREGLGQSNTHEVGDGPDEPTYEPRERQAGDTE
jgi:hypothetical protein